MKKCTKCKTEKELIYFSKDKQQKHGFRNTCKFCAKEYYKEYYESNKEKIIQSNKESNKKYYESNKEHYKEYNKEYYKEYSKANKEKIKEYRKANKEKVKEYNKEYYKDNKDKLIEKQNKYLSKRRKTQPLFKLRCNLRNRTRSAFKNKSYYKTSKTQEMLGVDWEVCKANIERQFTKDMNWSNYGEWHIDHIIPLASASTEEELKKLCHYSNLQPLWAFDNLIKSAKINGQQNKFRF
jgi:hypothetical protein